MWIHDKLIKIECHSCGEEFLVSEYVLKQKTDEEYPGDGCYCPYCGSQNTEATTWSGDDTDYADEMGCLSISHAEIGEGETLSKWEVCNENTGEKAIVEALDWVHALTVFQKAGHWGPGQYNCRPVDESVDK